LCTASLDGFLNFWNVADGTLKGSIEGRKDIQGGRRRDDPREAKNSTHSLCFTSLCYGADGRFILAGGNSKFVCIYEINNKILIKKFIISSNLSMEGILDYLNSRNYDSKENISKELLLNGDEDSDKEDRVDRSLPGAKTGDFSDRNTPQVARTKCVKFSPTGQQWAAASTEGLLLYSLDEDLTFDPTDLDMEVTESTVNKTIKNKEYTKGLTMALKLNENKLIIKALESTPISDIPLVARSIPKQRLQRLLDIISSSIQDSPFLEFYLNWTRQILTLHGPFLKKNYIKLLKTLRALHKSLLKQQKDIAQLCDENEHLLRFLSKGSQGTTVPKDISPTDDRTSRQSISNSYASSSMSIPLDKTITKKRKIKKSQQKKSKEQKKEELTE